MFQMISTKSGGKGSQKCCKLSNINESLYAMNRFIVHLQLSMFHHKVKCKLNTLKLLSRNN